MALALPCPLLFRRVSPLAFVKGGTPIVYGMEGTFANFRRTFSSVITASQMSGCWRLLSKTAQLPYYQGKILSAELPLW